jgi:hypothetical protein
MKRSICAIVFCLVACSEDPPCQDAVIVQLSGEDGVQTASCKVTFFAKQSFEAAVYEFVMPPVYHLTPWECPELDIVPPKKHRIECATLSGPEPTSCFADGGCLSLLFWKEAATNLGKALGTRKLSVGAECDGKSTQFIPYDEQTPSEVFCRDPETGSAEH